MLTNPQIKLARGIATSAHSGQVDKIKAPYIEHPAMVAFLVQLLSDFATADASIQEAAGYAAWLHDTVEDTEVTADNLTAVGLSPELVAAVVALTRTPEIEQDEYYLTIRFHAVALLVKTADLASNLAPERVAQLDADGREWFGKKYSHALEELRVDRSVITKLHEVTAARRATSSNPGRRRRHTVIDLHTHSDRSDDPDAPSVLVMKATGPASPISPSPTTTRQLLGGGNQGRGLGGTAPHPEYRADQQERGSEPTSAGLRARSRFPELGGADATRSGGAGGPNPADGRADREECTAVAPRGREAFPGGGHSWQTSAPARGHPPSPLPHIAEALVACGACANAAEALERYLLPSTDTYVARWAPSIEDAIQNASSSCARVGSEGWRCTIGSRAVLSGKSRPGWPRNLDWS